MKPNLDEIEDYYVAEGSTRALLRESVKEQLADGWRVQGGVGSYWNGVSGYYTQAMVKFKVKAAAQGRGLLQG